MTDTTTSTRPRLVTVRSTVHVTTCWQARRPDVSPVPFDAEGSAALAIDIATSDLQPCKKCKPVSRLAWWERSHR